jgi:predicted phage-related endonuclease
MVMSDLDPKRIGCITASRIAGMLAKGKGVTRGNYAAELAASRLTGKPHRDSFTSAALEHGTEFEAMARMQYELRNGVMVEGTGSEFILHPFIERSGASPDGLIGDDGVWEAKCPNTATFIEYKLSGEIPQKYKLQMLWQLACTRRKWADFVAFDPDLPEEDGYLQIRFTPTAQEIADLEREVRAFDAEVELLIQTIISKRTT